MKANFFNLTYSPTGAKLTGSRVSLPVQLSVFLFPAGVSFKKNELL